MDGGSFQALPAFVPEHGEHAGCRIDEGGEMVGLKIRPDGTRAFGELKKITGMPVQLA